MSNTPKSPPTQVTLNLVATLLTHSVADPHLKPTDRRVLDTLISQAIQGGTHSICISHKTLSALMGGVQLRDVSRGIHTLAHNGYLIYTPGTVHGQTSRLELTAPDL